MPWAPTVWWLEGRLPDGYRGIDINRHTAGKQDLHHVETTNPPKERFVFSSSIGTEDLFPWHLLFLIGRLKSIGIWTFPNFQSLLKSSEKKMNFTVCRGRTVRKCRCEENVSVQRDYTIYRSLYCVCIGLDNKAVVRQWTILPSQHTDCQTHVEWNLERSKGHLNCTRHSNNDNTKEQSQHRVVRTTLNTLKTSQPLRHVYHTHIHTQTVFDVHKREISLELVYHTLIQRQYACSYDMNRTRICINLAWHDSIRVLQQRFHTLHLNTRPKHSTIRPCVKCSRNLVIAGRQQGLCGCVPLGANISLLWTF